MSSFDSFADVVAARTHSLTTANISEWRHTRPTFDRPFGARLWPTFEGAFEWIFGYERHGFKLVIGETPLSAFKDVVAVLALYYTVVLCGPRLMRNRKPLHLPLLFRLYNLLLVGSSALICLLFVEQMVPTIKRHGLLFSICELNGGFTDELTLLYYVSFVDLAFESSLTLGQVNYLMKYLELFDTVFLILKKKPLSKSVSS